MHYNVLTSKMQMLCILLANTLNLSARLHPSDVGCVGCSVWDTRTRQIVQTLETSKKVLSLEIVDSNLFVTADDNFVKLWDANTFQVTKSFTLPYQVESASYSPQKHRFAAGGEDMWVHLYDDASGQEVDTNKGMACG